MASQHNALTTTRPVALEERSPKNRVLAFLLVFFFGVFGVHRFYVGKFWTGLLLLFTGGGFGFWWIIDAIMLLIGRFKDSEGRVLGPPQYTHQALAHPQRPHQDRAPAQLTASSASSDTELDFGEKIEDPLEAEFAELERQMKSRGQ